MSVKIKKKRGGGGQTNPLKISGGNQRNQPIGGKTNLRKSQLPDTGEGGKTQEGTCP